MHGWVVASDRQRRRVGMTADHGDLALGGHARGLGMRAVLPESPGGSFVNITSTPASAAMERVASVSARLNGSSGASFRLDRVDDQLKATLAVDCGRSSPKQR